MFRSLNATTRLNDDDPPIGRPDRAHYWGRPQWWAVLAVALGLMALVAAASYSGGHGGKAARAGWPASRAGPSPGRPRLASSPPPPGARGHRGSAPQRWLLLPPPLQGRGACLRWRPARQPLRPPRSRRGTALGRWLTPHSKDRVRPTPPLPDRAAHHHRDGARTEPLTNGSTSGTSPTTTTEPTAQSYPGYLALSGQRLGHLPNRGPAADRPRHLDRNTHTDTHRHLCGDPGIQNSEGLEYRFLSPPGSASNLGCSVTVAVPQSEKGSVSYSLSIAHTAG